MRHVPLGFLLMGCFVFTACGGSMNTLPPTGGVPMSLTIGDTPPNGVAVLFFESLITGASLQPSDTTKPAVSVLNNPVEVEFAHLQTDTAFLHFQNVAPGTYQSMTLTFGNPVMTIVNHSGAAIGSCANNAVCETTPTFNPSSAMISTTPFPITLDQNSVVGIRLDFNLNSSVQSDLSINPVVTVSHFTQRQDSDDDMEMDQIDEVDGEVTGTASGQFSLMDERSGQSFTITVDSNTQFEDFDRAGCMANPADLSCVMSGQILDVTLSENGMGAMLAKRVEFEENANTAAIKGTITSVDSGTQFHMVVFNEEAAAGGVTEGSPVVVTIQSGAVFQIGREEMGEDGGFSIAGLSFASSADLMVGQDVQIRPGTASTSGGVTTIPTNLVRLWPSQITGLVGGMSAMNGAFTLTGLSPLFTGATSPVTTINVVTLSDVDFMDFSGLSSLTPGSTVSIRGLLFNTTGTPTLVTRAMREHNGD